MRNFFSSPAAATRSLILINVIVYLGQVASGGLLTSKLVFAPLYTLVEPWRMITAGFAHSDGFFSSPTTIFHIALNMYTLYILGNLLEPMLGTVRFVWLYMLSLLGGSVAVLVLGDPVTSVLGASGAVFGLMAAYLVVLRSLGQNASGATIVIALNLIFTFLNPMSSWQGHVGGLIVGAGVTWLYAQTRSSQKAVAQKTGLILILVALIAVSVVRATMLTAAVW